MFLLKNKLMQAAAENMGSPTQQVAPTQQPAAVQQADLTKTDTTKTSMNTEPTKGAWPDNWRDRFSSGDEKKANIAARYTSPEAAFDALIAAQNKIHSGNLKEVKPFPDKGTPEEQTAWRKDNGLPEAPDKYSLDGLVIGEKDKPFIDDFLKAAHSKNLSNEQAAAVVEWHFANQEAQMQAREEKDSETAKQVQDALRQEWGGEYRANMNRVESLLGTAPAGVKEKLLSARFHDGTAVFNDPSVLKFLAGLSMEINPATTLVGGGGDQVSAIGDEIGKIEKFMRSNKSDYFKDEDMQLRLRKLYEAREKLGRKAS